jgi:putative membrane protein
VETLHAVAEEILPAINAGLNALAATLLICGLLAVRTQRLVLHRRLMITAMGTSALFLACYLLRAALTGTHRFEGPPAWRHGYMTLLISHMILAACVVPLVARTAWLGLKDRREEHRRIARWTFPIWLYVSVTGVIIYVLLYHVSGHVG